MQAVRIPLILAFSLTAPLSAFASSPEAWEEFRQDVETTCTASLPEVLATPTVYVEPTGTEAFGVALIEGLSPESKARVTYVCVYDKQTKAVELTPAIASEFVHVVTESEREAIAKQRAETGDNKTVDEAGQE
jgi:hypothetical protein